MVCFERRTRSTPTVTKNYTHAHESTQATATRRQASESKIATRIATMERYERTFNLRDKF